MHSFRFYFEIICLKIDRPFIWIRTTAWIWGWFARLQEKSLMEQIRKQQNKCFLLHSTVPTNGTISCTKHPTASYSKYCKTYNQFHEFIPCILNCNEELCVQFQDDSRSSPTGAQTETFLWSGSIDTYYLSFTLSPACAVKLGQGFQQQWYHKGLNWQRPWPRLVFVVSTSAHV